MKVFTKFEDLPGDVRKSGVKFEDGWIRAGGKYMTLRQNDIPLKNAGIRTRVRFDPASDAYANLNLRSSSAGRLTLSRDRTGALHRLNWITSKSQQRTLVTFDLGRSLMTGEHIVEFCVFGDRAVCRFDSHLKATKFTGDYASGHWSLGGSEDLRDIEVINLDGLSEAEALKILGVDEKGNDLRAAALAVERQAMEQAKVVDAASAIPELKALHEQFVKLTAERVTAPFEAEVAKLNAGYVGGIDREIASEKKAGRLDGVIALEAEKKLIADKLPIPAEDDEKTTEALKKLRAIYRDAYAQLEATRAANLKALTDPLIVRLKALVADLTRQDRVADAKKVREYREALEQGSAATPDRSSPNGAEAAKTNESDKSARVPQGAADHKGGFTNSLGMKFLPVKGTDVLFCIHETRRQDYAAYANEVPGVSGLWMNQMRDGVPCGDKDDHPVVGVSWDNAAAFCAWLSKKEGKTYRLPTDREWSYAVGIGRDERWTKTTTPESLKGLAKEFPWGGDFPPETKDQAGNYGDSAWHEKFPTQPWLERYSDGFPTTAPVMSFKPNEFGLYDMGGNAREWVEDWWNEAQADRVMRGAFFGHITHDSLLSSFRDHAPPNRLDAHGGFRVVVEVQ